jgi:MFS family permease
MDPSEGRPYIEASEQELPPLYESVNSRDSEEKSSPCSNINRTLLPFKAFYYFFYGAIGSLFPFIALYFRHLWLSPTQAGLLVGLRPIIQSITTPFWALSADRFNAKKIVLFIGLCGWLFAHTSILLVPAGKKPLSCVENSTHVTKRSVDFSYDPLPNNILGEEYNPYPQEILDYNPVDRKQRNQNPRDSLSYDSDASDMKLFEQENPSDHVRFSREQFPNKSSSQNSMNISSEIKTKDTIQPNLADKDESNLDSKNNDNGKGSWWTLSSMHEPLGTWHTFTYLFLVILMGNLFAAPAQTMANTATLQVLGDDTYKYGAQRCFGSIGWGVSAFVVGMLVSMNHDSSLACNGSDDINYSPCFYAFGFLMLCALVVAIPFKFQNPSEVNPHETRAHLVQVYQQLDCLTLFVFFTVLLAGFNMGFIQTFLFWYLQSLGGSQTLFSLILGFNAVGEMIGFLLSVKLISKYGHLKVLALGIFAYVVRLTVYGVVENPWLVLTVEFLKAFTSSAVWAGAMSYVGDSCYNGSTLAAIAHMLYWGIGYGGGAMLGGVLMEAVGAPTTFLGLAVISLCVVILILVVVQLNCCPKRKQDIYMPVESDDEELEQESD